jgi:thermitase
MKWFRLSVVLTLILCLLLTSVPALADSGTTAANYAPDRIIVKYRDGTDPIVARGLAGRHGDSEAADLTSIGAKVIKIPAGKLRAKLAEYRSDPSVLYAEPDYTAYAVMTPNDTYYSNEWGLATIDASQAWDVTRGLPTVKIAILDTGVDQNHPDLAGKILASVNYSTSSTTDDLYGHGTHCAGIAAAATNNSIGVAGLGYNTSILNVKVLNDSGSGSYSSIISGITWAVNNGANVISMSLGGGSSSSALKSAIDDAWNKGVVVVAAAGNSNSSSLFYPAGYSNCIAVAATSQSDIKASFSNYGSWVDVAAPGEYIYSTLPNHTNQIGGLNYGYLSGTSMATPFVAGLAGLIWSTSYGTSAASVRSRIESTADTIAGTGTYWTYGRIDAYKAVSNAVVDITPPPQVTGLAVVTASSSQLNLAWAASSATDVAKYNVYRSPSSIGLFELKASPTTNSYSNTGLTASTTYYYQVSAVDNSGNEGPRSSIASATTAGLSDTTPPSQVTGVIASAVSYSQINLSWAASTAPDLNNYRVYRSTSATGTFSLIASPTTNSYSNTGLTASTPYYYQVSAVDKSGNEGARSSTASTTTGAAPAKQMHIAGISMSLSGSSYVRATAVITVVDANGTPVSSARVYGHWSVATTDSDSATTNTSGRATVYSNSVYRPASGKTYVFTVDRITRSGWTYNPAANIITSNSISVP